ncbi:MAG: putative inorganic carbon transporter subunit DabA [Bacteroidia bacterium]
MKAHSIDNLVTKASEVLGNTWPLYSFETSNPLRGFEKLPFPEAVEKAKDLLHSRVYPEASVFRKALQNGSIDRNELLGLLHQHGYSASPEACLEQMEARGPVRRKTSFTRSTV